MVCVLDFFVMKLGVIIVSLFVCFNKIVGGVLVFYFKFFVKVFGKIFVKEKFSKRFLGVCLFVRNLGFYNLLKFM